jgi:hypothetical protein
MTQLKPGSQLRSTVCTTEVVVVRPPADEVELQCGGQPMVDKGAGGESTGAPDPAWAGGTQLGKRYVHEGVGVELLCTKAGEGGLSVNGEPLEIKGAKPLPSSD